MGCSQLIQGLDITCKDVVNRYYQQIVLINRADVDQVLRRNSNSAHRISFSLKAGKSGVLFRGNETASAYRASYSKKTEMGIPLYQHHLELPVLGVTEDIKLILKQLDTSDVFAAIQFRDGTVEIYGFEGGLVTSDYTYDVQTSMGGSIIPLESRHEETAIPYVYYGKGNEETHFNNLFANIGNIIAGDFNDDFSNDFDNIYLAT